MRSVRVPGPPDRPGSSAEKRRRAEQAEGRAAFGFYITTGIQFGAVLLVFTALGYWLDTRLHTLPLLTLLGAALGGVGGFLHLYRTLTAVGSGEDRGS